MMFRPRGAITLVFDDGYDSIYEKVVPYLNQHSVPAVFAVALDHQAIEESEKRKVLPYATWLQLRQRGHEIAAHSISHRNLTRLSSSDLTRELAEPARVLKAHTIVYPGGAHNDAVIGEAKKHYQAGRTVFKGFEKKMPRNSFALKTYNFTRRNFSPWRANLLALWAWCSDQWLIETYHLVDNGEQEKEHAVNFTDFVAHVNFLRKLPIKITTIQQMFATRV